MKNHIRRAALLLVVSATISTSSARGSIYVTNIGPDKIGKYNDDGTAANSSLVTGLSNPYGLVLSDDATSLFVTGFFVGSVGQYDATTGAAINPSLITGLTAPIGIALSGDNLFISDSSAGTIGKYTTSGATINAALVSGLSQPRNVAVSKDGTKLFVAESLQGAIKLYDANTGATLNDALVAGLNAPWGIALSADESSIYVTESGLSRIGHYNAANGAPINVELVFGLNQPHGIALSGSNLFVANSGNGTIGKYAVSGAVFSEGFISGIGNPSAIVVNSVPLLGDFDGDSDIDIVDYLQLSTNLFTNVTALTTQQSYVLGDFTGDLRINGDDFVRFRTAYDEANGVGAFVAMVNALPEPSTGLLAGVACAMLIWRRRPLDRTG